MYLYSFDMNYTNKHYLFIILLITFIVIRSEEENFDPIKNAINRALKPVKDTINKVKKDATNYVDKTTKKITDEVGDKFKKFGDEIEKGIDKQIDNVSKDFEKVGKDINKMKGTVEGSISKVKSDINREMDKLEKGFDGVWSEFGKVDDMIKKNVVDPAIRDVRSKYITPIASSVTQLAQGLGKVYASVESVAGKGFDELKDLPQKVADLPTTVKKEVVDPAIDAIEKDVINPIKKTADDALGEIKGLPNKIEREVVNPAINTVKTKVIKPIENKANQAINEVKGLPNKIKKDIVDPAIDGIEDKVVDPIKDWVKQALKDIFKGLQTFINTIATIPNKIKGAFGKIIDDLIGIFEKVAGGFTSIEDVFKSIGLKIVSIVTSLLSTIFAPLISSLITVVQLIFGTVWNYIKQKIWIAQYLDYILLLMIVGIFGSPFILLVIILSLLLFPLIGAFAFLIPLIFIIIMPFVLKSLIVNTLYAIMSLDIWSIVKNSLSPSTIEKIVQFMAKSVKDGANKLKLDDIAVTGITEVKNHVNTLVKNIKKNKVKNLGVIKDVAKFDLIKKIDEIFSKK